MPTGVQTPLSQELGLIPRRKRSAFQAGSPALVPGHAAYRTAPGRGLQRAVTLRVSRQGGGLRERQVQGMGDSWWEVTRLTRFWDQRWHRLPRYPPRPGDFQIPLLGSDRGSMGKVGHLTGDVLNALGSKVARGGTRGWGSGWRWGRVMRGDPPRVGNLGVG